MESNPNMGFEDGGFDGDFPEGFDPNGEAEEAKKPDNKWAYFGGGFVLFIIVMSVFMIRRKRRIRKLLEVDDEE